MGSMLDKQRRRAARAIGADLSRPDVPAGAKVVLRAQDAGGAVFEVVAPAPASTVLARILVDAAGERATVELVGLPRMPTVGDRYDAELPRRLGFPPPAVAGVATVAMLVRPSFAPEHAVIVADRHHALEVTVRALSTSLWAHLAAGQPEPELRSHQRTVLDAAGWRQARDRCLSAPPPPRLLGCDGTAYVLRLTATDGSALDDVELWSPPRDEPWGALVAGTVTLVGDLVHA